MTAIVVPVFNAPAQTARCLQSIEQTVDANQPVVVIDDASDDPTVTPLLERLPAYWVLIRNSVNLGFVATANLGMVLAGTEDVILLNADTVVTTGWLAAIEACAASDERIASITPLTNNGEIASIPQSCQAGPMPEDPERWAEACRRAGSPVYQEVPTAVGFCMFLRRACLDQIGLFDEAVFGRGYGEENDWCMRALKAGWRHVLCDQAYVAHEGNASFGPLGIKPNGEAMDRLLARHPDYLERINPFIENDPLAERRLAIWRCYLELGGR